jgi:signal transduction histidine kinase
LDLLQRRAERERHAANLHDSAELRRGVDRLGRLIADLLDVARIDQGLFSLTLQPMDLVAAAREAAEAVTGPGITVALDAPAELRVVADPARIRQALENLLANAVQHTPPDGTVDLRVTYEGSGPKPLAVVLISDQGSGIDPTLLPRLFERFSRSSSSAGLGIGLFLTRQIAEAHRGGVQVSSSSRDGTRFKLFLPAESVQPET